MRFNQRMSTVLPEAARKLLIQASGDNEPRTALRCELKSLEQVA